MLTTNFGRGSEYKFQLRVEFVHSGELKADFLS